MYSAILSPCFARHEDVYHTISHSRILFLCSCAVLADFSLAIHAIVRIAFFSARTLLQLPWASQERKE